MARKSKPIGADADWNLASLSPLFVDEEKARQFLEAKGGTKWHKRDME